MEDKFFFGTEKDNMTIDEYLTQINAITEYYYKNCEKYKRKFYICCFLRIISSAIIPIIALGSGVNWSTITVSVLASIMTITESYINVTRAYEKWVNYRQTCNFLWIEQRFFAMKIGEYSDDDTREKAFVKKCEAFMLEEIGEWKSYIERAKEMK